MQQVQNGSAFAQKLWGARVTLYTENQCVLPHLYGKGEDAIINVGDKQDIVDNGRGSQVQIWFGDRFRGQSLGPQPLGATQFGAETGSRPVYSQTMIMQAQELSSTGLYNIVAGQTYTNVPLEKKELRDCGAEAAEIICRSCYYHLAGITAYNTSTFSAAWKVPPMGNLVTEHDAAHAFYTNGKTSDATVAADSASILTVEFLETIITKLQNRAFVKSPLSPGNTPWGDGFFVFICDSEGNEQLTRHSASNRFTSITLAELQGGQALDKVASYMQANQGFQSTRRILVIVDDYTPFGQSGTTPNATTAGTQIGNVRRGMLLGRMAMHMRWGQGFDADSTHIMATHHSEYTQEGWKFYTHWGGLRTIPTSDPTPQSFGCAVVSYYVAASTPTV